jgi:hypothetical protein
MLWRRRNLNSSDMYYSYYQIITIFLTVRYKEVLLYNVYRSFCSAFFNGAAQGHKKL